MVMCKPSFSNEALKKSIYILYYFVIPIFSGKIVKVSCTISREYTQDYSLQFMTPILFTGLSTDAKRIK